MIICDNIYVMFTIFDNIDNGIWYFGDPSDVSNFWSAPLITFCWENNKLGCKCSLIIPYLYLPFATKATLTIFIQLLISLKHLRCLALTKDNQNSCEEKKRKNQRKQNIAHPGGSTQSLLVFARDDHQAVENHQQPAPGLS